MSTFVTVTEKWGPPWHTDEIRTDIHRKLDSMQVSGKFITCPLNNYDRSTYNTDGSPTKTFTSVDSANEYIQFISNLNPISVTINVFQDLDSCIAYLKTVTDPNHVGHASPVHAYPLY